MSDVEREDEETSKQRSNTVLYIAALITMLLIAAGLATLGSYFLPLLFFTVFSSALLMGAIGLLLGLEISLIIASLRRNIDEDAFLPDQTERSYAIVILGMGLGLIAALLLAIAFPSALGLFAFAGPGAFAILGALGLIAGLAVVGIVFLAVDLLGISPNAFEKLSIAQPFKGISRLMGLKELEQRKRLSKPLKVQKKKKTPQPKKIDESKAKHSISDKEREEKKGKEKENDPIPSPSSLGLVITALPQDSTHPPSPPASPPHSENGSSFSAPTSAQHGHQDEHEDMKVVEVAADSELLAAIPKPQAEKMLDFMRLSTAQIESKKHSLATKKLSAPKDGFFQLLADKVKVQVSSSAQALKGNLEFLHTACITIANSDYYPVEDKQAVGVRKLLKDFQKLEAALANCQIEQKESNKLEPLAASLEQYKVNLIIQVCIDPVYNQNAESVRAREKFMENPSPAVIEKVRRGLQAHIATLKEGDGAEARNAAEIARLGKVIEDGLRKPGVAVEPK